MNRFSTIHKTIALAAAALIALVASVAIAFQVSSWSRIKPGVAVLDVPVGGLTLDQAETRLAPRALAILDQPVELQLDHLTWTTSARQMGVRLDPTDLAQSAFQVGREDGAIKSLNTQVDVLRNGYQVPVLGRADGAQLDALVGHIAEQIDRPARDAHLAINPDGTLDFGTSETGLRLDQATSRTAIAQALTTGEATVTLTAQPIQPQVLTEQVAAARDQLARILDTQPIQLSAADYKRSLDEAAVRELIELNQPSDGKPASVTVNPDVLQPYIDAAASAVDRTPVNARFSWNGDELSVLRPSKDGRALDRQAAVDLLNAQILAGARSIDLPVTTVQAPVSSDDGGAHLGIHDLIERSTTAFAGSVPEKAHNIRLAAQRLNGVVVPPGGTFSFNAEVGPTTIEEGFQWGFGLTTGSNGGAHTVPAVAGGICQVATTLFQPVFWGGFQLEERYWHLYWIPSYTSRDVVGLDATVDEDAGLDFKWINPTNDYVLIQSATDAEHVTFSLYGHKPDWKVHVEQPVISNRVAPDPAPDVQAEPLLPWGRVVPVETARDGFQVVITRHVTSPDGAQRDLVLKSTYQPGHNVTLVGSANAPDAATVLAAVDRVRDGMQPAAAAAPPPPTYDTANGARTLTEIREELRHAGWGGGSDQDAVATYRRLASEATGGH